MKDFLLVDCCGYTTNMNLMEATTKMGLVKFRGKFQEANAVNKNKRMYPFETLDENVKKLKETMEARGLYGELDHPTDSIVHLNNVSHIVTDLWWENNVLMGEGEILPTPSGLILKKLIESGCRIGISSRSIGNGTTNNEGVLVIAPGLKVITFDMVADPSTYSAFQEVVTGPKTKKESVEPVIINNFHVNTKKSDPNAFVSYFGTVLEQQMDAIRKKGIRLDESDNYALIRSSLDNIIWTCNHIKNGKVPQNGGSDIAQQLLQIEKMLRDIANQNRMA